MQNKKSQLHNFKLSWNWLPFDDNNNVQNKKSQLQNFKVFWNSRYQ